jgi:hypothetical protein
MEFGLDLRDDLHARMTCSGTGDAMTRCISMQQPRSKQLRYCGPRGHLIGISCEISKVRRYNFSPCVLGT